MAQNWLNTQQQASNLTLEPPVREGLMYNVSMGLKSTAAQNKEKEESRCFVFGRVCLLLKELRGDV